jgi:RNA polymerase sigma factor (sigma-70 family)
MAPLKGSSVSSSFGNDSDEDLLFFMGMKDEDPFNAKQAWAEFYSRHVEYLHRACLYAYGNTLGEPGVEDLVHNTFIRAYERASTFQASDQKGNPDSERAHVRAWLGKIAENLLRDSFRRTCTLTLVTDDELDLENSRNEPRHSEESSTEIQGMAEALSTLTEKEQDILRLTALWYRPGKELRIPPDELQKLASVYSTTAVTIRQIRKRAIEKVKTYIESKKNVAHQQRERTAHG